MGNERFKIMERRLYYAIMWPAALVTSLLGILLVQYLSQHDQEALWMKVKLALVGLLWVYHLSCGHVLKGFAHNKNTASSVFYRFYNEVPTLLLISIILLAELKPF